MPATYEPISTQTVSGTSTASIDFSSIPATYTDLRVIATGTGVTAGSIRLRFNSDSGTNYSYTEMYGDGTSALSSRATSTTSITLAAVGLSTTIPHLHMVDIFSYAGSTNKTCLVSLAEDNNGSGYVYRSVGLWRNTSAITTVSVLRTSGFLGNGFTATLYGIKAA